MSGQQSSDGCEPLVPARAKYLGVATPTPGASTFHGHDASRCPLDSARFLSQLGSLRGAHG